MNIKITLGILVMLVFFSCTERTPKNKTAELHADLQEIKINSGITIENKPNRGTFFHDSLGVKYGITYIPVTIKNDSTIPLKVRIDFSKDYSFPQPNSNEKFKLLPLPKVWALDGINITNQMLDQLPYYLDNPKLTKTLAPGENLIFAIGTYRSIPSNASVPIPNALFTQNNKSLYKDCDLLSYQDSSNNAPLSLGLKLFVDINTTSPWCTLISCGSISYLDN